MDKDKAVISLVATILLLIAYGGFQIIAAINPFDVPEFGRV